MNCLRKMMTVLFFAFASGENQILLNGAGSTSVRHLFNDAALTYSFVQPNVALDYAALDSSRGTCRIESTTRKCDSGDQHGPREIDFAISEIPLSQGEYDEFPDLQMYPTSGVAIVPVYNLGPSASLTLSTSVLAQIFRGVITTWDDPQIIALNHDFHNWAIPARQPIRLVARENGSGTTFIFKTALSAFDPEFKRCIRSDASAKWPSVVNVTLLSDNLELVAYVLSHQYSLGYASLADALDAQVPMAKLLKPNGAVVEANVESAEFAMLELGTKFGNTNEPAKHLVADLSNAKASEAWPIVGYTYLVLRKSTLRPGATCTHVQEALAFWIWLLKSPVAHIVIEHVGFCNLPDVVRDIVVNRLLKDTQCVDQSLQQRQLTAIAGSGLGMVSGFFRHLSTIYKVMQPDVELEFNATERIEAIGIEESLKTNAFIVSTSPPAVPLTDGATVLVGGLALGVVTQMEVVLDAVTLALILDGAIVSWTDPRISQLNPNGIHGVQEGDPIHLLRGPTVSHATLEPLMKNFLPKYTGSALHSAPVFPSEESLLIYMLECPTCLAITPFFGALPRRLRMASMRRPDGTVVPPSVKYVQNCATAETIGCSSPPAHLFDPSAKECYPLSIPLYISVQKSECNEEADGMRTQAVQFVEWLTGKSAVANAISAANVAPLRHSSPEVIKMNQAALEMISCRSLSSTRYFNVIGPVVGIAAALLICISIAVWYHRSGLYNNRAAPKDPSRPFCVLFTDIQASTHLWAVAPTEMAHALDCHHSIIRQLISRHGLYEVKTIGDSFMCVVRDPRRAMAFALDVQRELYAYNWGTHILDAIYLKQEGHGLAGWEDIPKWYSPIWSGLRVRVGLHYGLGEMKLDNVSKRYDYYGTLVNVAARIEAVCHGGQIAVSEEFFNQLEGQYPDSVWTDLGSHTLRGVSEPVHLFQVLPAGPLASRLFPALRLDHMGVTAEVQGGLSDNTYDQCLTTATRSSLGMANFQPEGHPLVLKGIVSAEVLQDQYDAAMRAVTTLLTTQTSAFRYTTLQGLCDRLKVRHYGCTGVQLQETLHGLVLRILPSMVNPQNEPCSVASLRTQLLSPKTTYSTPRRRPPAGQYSISPKDCPSTAIEIPEG